VWVSHIIQMIPGSGTKRYSWRTFEVWCGALLAARFSHALQRRVTSSLRAD
jgi:hypothetical protein